MNNADQPASPSVHCTMDPENGDMIPDQWAGLTKREHIAATLSIYAGEFSINDKATFKLIVGRDVDHTDPLDMMQAVCELEAKFRVMKADALLAELEKTP